MQPKLLIDADSILYRSAAAAEGKGPQLAVFYLEQTLERIFNRTGIRESECEILFGGSSEPRQHLSSSYKANRIGKPKPEYLPDTLEAIAARERSFCCSVHETDDHIAHRAYSAGFNICIASIDKDLRQLPCRFYNYVSDVIDEVDPTQALHNFYEQMLMGDKSDNVPGFDGVARYRPTKQLERWIKELKELEKEEDMISFTLEKYNDQVERYLLSGNLLYLLRHEEDYWFPKQLQHRLTGLDRSKPEREALYDYIAMMGVGINPSTEPSSTEKDSDGFLLVGL